MKIDDKSGAILKYLSILQNNGAFPEDEYLDNEDENFDIFCQRALEEIILKYSDNKYSKELFIRLKYDGVFKIVPTKYTSNLVEVEYNGEFIPYRLDLADHSSMGFAVPMGNSSQNQLSLAILSVVVGDKEALKYYQELSKSIAKAITHNRKQQTTYLEIYKLYLELKREKMKNMVKYVCSELNITQRALSEEIGVSEGTVNRWSAKPDEIPLQTQKTLKLILENFQLKDNQEKLLKAISLIEEVKNTQNSIN